MAEKIKDNWESYSFAEFTLKKSILKEQICAHQANNEALFQKVPT